MKFALPVVYLALSIPTAVVAALQGGGGGGGGSIQAEKPTAAEAAMAKAARSPKIKPGDAAAAAAAAASRGLGLRASASASATAAAADGHRRLDCDIYLDQVGSVPTYNRDPNPFDDKIVNNDYSEGSIVGDKYDFLGMSYENFVAGFQLSEDGRTLIATAEMNSSEWGVNEESDPVFRYHEKEGAVKVFRLSADRSTWDLVKTFEGQERNGRLGYANALSADGNTVAFTDEFMSSSTGKKGIVHVWRYDGGSDVWTELGSGFRSEPAQNNDFFGRKISMSADGNTVAVLGKMWDNRSGEVTVWKYDAATNSWAQKGGTLNQGPSKMWLGIALSLSANGGRILLGNRGQDGGGPNGYARVYQYDGIDGDNDNIDGWTQLGSDIYPPVAEWDLRYSENVAMSADGTKIVVGAPTRNHFYTYQLSEQSQWELTAKVARPSEGVFFLSMSNGGNRIMAAGPPGWGLYDFDGNIIQGGSLNTRNGVAISGDGRSVAITDHTQYEGPVKGTDGRGVIYVYDLGDTCPADYGSMGALASVVPAPGPGSNPAYPSWFPPSTDGGDSSGIFLNEKKSFNGNRYDINWQGFSGNEARTACTWYKLAQATYNQKFNLFETGSDGRRRRFAHGQWMNYHPKQAFSFTTHDWGTHPHTPYDEYSIDTEWHHACVTWDGSSMKAYYDGQRLGDYVEGKSTLNPGNEFDYLDTGNDWSYWGHKQSGMDFRGSQQDLVFIKGKALSLEEIQAVRSLTGPTDFCGSDNNGCSHTCNSDDGVCSCPTGYFLAPDGKNCVDFDECSTSEHNCDANASCQNTAGGFTCTCNTGYAGDGVSCSDIDECTDGSHSCDANASCQNSPAGSHSCTCNAGYEGDGNTCIDINECLTDNGGCAHICTDTDGSFECSCRAGYALNDDNAGCSTIYIGAEQSVPAAEAAAAEAADTVTAFFTSRSAHEVASHNLDVATTQLEDATTAHAEAQAKATALTKEYEQAVAYEETMKKAFDDATARANADDATAAERYRLPIEAEIAYNEATAVKEAAEGAKNAAVDEEADALVDKNRATATKAQATAIDTAAKATLEQELAEVNANVLIPKINPTTLDFPYVDADGDLIPNDFDACPTQMGLRRNTNQRTSSENPGPQDFCPSGCPETGADGTTVLDSDGDGIPDCEDRCPFEAGIKYNHLWTWDKFNADEIDTLDANMAYHGCPDRDNDGIPDKFDACPTQAGGKCYSGCPDKGIDPVTQKAYDGDMDGVSDCDDRCPGFYGPGNSGGCPDGDFDGTPDYRDYCPSNPGNALFAYQRKLEDNAQKNMNILGCPDEDGDLVTDQADICDAPAYPNQDATTFAGLTRVAVVNNKGCPLDSDQDGVYDGIDNCDGTVHSANDVHDPRVIVFSPTDDGFSVADDEAKLGCPKDTDNDGVADGIDQCPTEGGYIGRDGCPIDSDNDGVKDCVSNQAPTSYTWPFQPTNCHSTSGKPDASCCTVEQDMCADTVRGATVYAKEYTHPKLDGPVDPGCSFDLDKDGVVDGVDLCPYTTETEIALTESNPNKVSIDDKGCATMSAPMWESTFVDVTTGSEGANPKVELLFTVDALLPQIATTRGYNVANELVAVQVMDASCTNTFDESDNELLPATITVNNAGSFTGQTPTGSIPITIDLNLNPDNVVGSEVWTTEPPFDVGSIDFCLGFSVLSDTKKSVTYKELKTTILIDMTQDFAVTDISVERNEAEETTKLIDIEYPLAACQCTSDNVCVEDSDLDDSFLSQSDSLNLCVRFAPDADNNDVLPPDYVQMTDVKSFTCNQGGLSISPIVNFERQGDGGQLTSVETVNKELGNGESYTVDDRMLVVSTRLPANFFGAEERPVDCVGTIVYEFAAGSVIDPDLVGTDRQRLLSEASVPLGQTSRREAEEAPEAEAESEFSVEVMLAKAAAGRSVGVIAGAAVASALVVASGAAVTTMAVRRPGSRGVPKMSIGQPSTQQQSWAETSASTQEEGRAFTISNGAVA